jgi:hypothetical protein
MRRGVVNRGEQIEIDVENGHWRPFSNRVLLLTPKICFFPPRLALSAPAAALPAVSCFSQFRWCRSVRFVLGVAADPLAAGIVRVPASNLYRFVNAVISITVTLAMLWQVA